MSVRNHNGARTRSWTMRRIIILIIALIIVAYMGYVFFFSGTYMGRAAQRSPYKVLMLLPGSIDDGSWNQVGFEALRRIGKEKKIDVVYRENVTFENGTKILREFINDKSLFVIGWGGEFRELLEGLALQYPAYKFAITGSYPGNGKNFGCLSLRNGAYYLAGALAALKNKSGKIGAIIGEELPHTKREFNAFKQGALSIRPDLQVSVNYLGTWEDSLKAIGATENMIMNAYDVILVNADRAGLPVHKMMEREGRYTIGVVNDAASLAPRAVLTSLMINAEVLLRKGIELFIQGRWEGKMYRYGLIDGATYLTEFNPVVDQKQRETLDRIRTDLITQRILIDGQTE